MPIADFAQGVKTPFFAMVNHTNDGTRASAKQLMASKTASPAATQTPAKTDSKTDSGESFLGDLIDVVNPLQHLPVVGTLYRSMTGDKIGDIEKVAGDTLYGGPIGLVSSLADVAFEKITGKDFGDTVMSWLDIGGTNTALASAKPATQQKTAVLVSTKSIAPQQTAALKSAIAPLVPQPAGPAAAAAPKPLTTSSPAPAPTQTVVDISPQTDALLASLQKNGVNGDMQLRALDAYRRTMDLNTTVPAIPQTIQ